MMYLSNMRIVHCDLRSANILIKGNLAKITDFGLSKVEFYILNLFNMPLNSYTINGARKEYYFLWQDKGQNS